MEINAMRYVTPDEMEEMMTVMNTGGSILIKGYMEKYKKMDPVKQGALGYINALMNAMMFGYQSARQIERSLLFYCPERRDFKIPFMFYGWAGAYNDLGPAYKINTECFAEIDELFYSDDDIADDRGEAEHLAREIARESSGIAQVRVERLVKFQMTYERINERWGIVFVMDKNAVKESVCIGSRPVTKDESGGFLFILPKVGEFNCILGHRNEDGCFALSKDIYCMK